jgi:hypothetical protein
MVQNGRGSYVLVAAVVCARLPGYSTARPVDIGRIVASSAYVHKLRGAQWRTVGELVHKNRFTMSVRGPQLLCRIGFAAGLLPSVTVRRSRGSAESAAHSH